MVTANLIRGRERVQQEFLRWGVLLESDRSLPNAVKLIVNRPVRGSWWGLPEARPIYQILGDFSSQPDVLIAKLISGKVTFVHRRLWPSLLVIATAKERWQLSGLSKSDSRLLHFVEDKGRTTTEEAKETFGKDVATSAANLELRLLVQTQQYHTSKGFHAKRLMSWKSWSRRVRLTGKGPDLAESKYSFERIIKDMNQKFDAGATLPWQ